jgi:hypothetical protein
MARPECCHRASRLQKLSQGTVNWLCLLRRDLAANSIRNLAVGVRL